MKNKFDNIFPIELHINNLDLEVKLLDDQYVDEYTNVIMSEHFKRYNKNIGDLVNADRVKLLLYRLARYYKNSDNLQDYVIRTIIVDKRNNSLVGGISMQPKDSIGENELGYWINPKYQDKGIMSSVLKRFTDKMLNEFNSIDYFRCKIMNDNIGSIKVAENAGFGLIGYTEEHDRIYRKPYIV